MQNGNDAFRTDRNPLHQLAQKQIEEMDQELTARVGVAKKQDSPGFPQNRRIGADLFSGIPDE